MGNQGHGMRRLPWKLVRRRAYDALVTQHELYRAAAHLQIDVWTRDMPSTIDESYTEPQKSVFLSTTPLGSYLAAKYAGEGELASPINVGGVQLVIRFRMPDADRWYTVIGDESIQN